MLTASQIQEWFHAFGLLGWSLIMTYLIVRIVRAIAARRKRSGLESYLLGSINQMRAASGLPPVKSLRDRP